MVKLLTCLLIIGAASAIAQEFEGKCNKDLVNGSDFIVRVSSNGLEMNSAHVRAWAQYHYKLNQFCRDDMRAEVYLDTRTQEVFKVFLTQSDECDGTSSKGLGFDLNDNVVMVVDSGSECPEYMPTNEIPFK